ncbi:MAG: hypothetical protein ACOYO1_11695 [Bacteroidales bacterium]
MNNIQDKDPILEKLLSQSTLYEPSVDFTQRIMATINQSEAVITKQPAFLIRHWYWLITSVLLISAIISIIYFPSFIRINTFHNYYKPYITAFESTLSLLKSQPLIPVIIYALTVLLLTDKLLSHFRHTKVQHS